MMRISKTFALIGILALAIGQAQADRAPRPGPKDPRIKTVVYNERDVITVIGHYGFSTVVEFADHEKVETLSLGDSHGWQVVPNKAGNKLFLKPIEHEANTNLSVETDKRSYIFELIARDADNHRDPRLNFRIKFVYPQDEFLVRERSKAEEKRLKETLVNAASAVPPEEWNFEYTFTGSKVNKPKRIFDDGKFTYFEFAQQAAIPAIFWVDTRRNESLINYTIKGRYVVVERVAAQFTLRNGDDETCIFNENYEHPSEKDSDVRARTKEDRDR